MPDRLPLAAAQARLGKPGRPRKPQLEAGHAPGTQAPRTRTRSGDAQGAPPTQGRALQPEASYGPRLLSVPAAGAYLGISARQTRELITAGRLRRVQLPGIGDSTLRRTLIDRADLDRLIDQSKEPEP